MNIENPKELIYKIEQSVYLKFTDVNFESYLMVGSNSRYTYGFVFYFDCNKTFYYLDILNILYDNNLLYNSTIVEYFSIFYLSESYLVVQTIIDLIPLDEDTYLVKYTEV